MLIPHYWGHFMPTIEQSGPLQRETLSIYEVCISPSQDRSVRHDLSGDVNALFVQSVPLRVGITPKGDVKDSFIATKVSGKILRSAGYDLMRINFKNCDLPWRTFITSEIIKIEKTSTLLRIYGENIDGKYTENYPWKNIGTIEAKSTKLESEAPAY